MTGWVLDEILSHKKSQQLTLPWLPEQAWLLPPSANDWLPKEHLSFFLLDLIAQLDLDPILHLHRQHALWEASRAQYQGHGLHSFSQGTAP